MKEFLIDTAKQVAIWVAKNFGKELVVVTAENIQHRWRGLFAKRDILVLGPKQAGKSSLIQHIITGRPFEIVDGEVRPPAPTAMAAIIDSKFSLQKGHWLKLRTDVPGDLDLRETWALAITELRPHGIIYIVDGRKKDEALCDDVHGILEHVLAHYSKGAAPS